jgi:hypothetical protein
MDYLYLTVYTGLLVIPRLSKHNYYRHEVAKKCKKKTFNMKEYSDNERHQKTMELHKKHK